MNNTALQYSVKLLSRRDYSEFKLRVKLQNKQFQDFEIDEAIEALKIKKYINEENYTENRIIELILRNYGNLYIINKLNEEKLYPEEININKIRTERNMEEENIIQILLIKKAHSLKDIPLLKKKNKINSYLTAKGFDFYSIEKVIESLT